MQIRLKQKQKGFTLIELVIVVAVIAILASITIVAYRGVRERAVTAAYTETVNQINDLLQLEITKTGRLPNAPDIFCVGSSFSDFPADDIFAAGECVKVSSGISYSYNSTFVDALRHKNNLPNGLLPVTRYAYSAGGTTYTSRGILLSVYDSHGFYVLQWFPQVSGECGRGRPVVSSDPGALTGDLCSIVEYY